MPSVMTVLRVLCANAGSSRSWEGTLEACPGVVAGCCLSSTGVMHDIVFDDVHKCQPFQEPAPLATLFERRKNKLNVAQCGSRAARFHVAPRRVACCLRPKSCPHVGQMWGTIRCRTSSFIVHRSSFPLPHPKHFQCGGMWGFARQTPVVCP